MVFDIGLADWRHMHRQLHGIARMIVLGIAAHIIRIGARGDQQRHQRGGLPAHRRIDAACDLGKVLEQFSANGRVSARFVDVFNQAKNGVHDNVSGWLWAVIHTYLC